MSRNYYQVQIVAVVVLSFVLCSHHTHRAHAQFTSGEQCRSQCYSAYQFYARFITSSSFLQNYLPSCYSRCPPVYVNPTTSTTTTTTTSTTTTTTTSARYGACGISNSARQRIVGGEYAGYCEFPWVVAVTVGTLFCGGTILDERHILTAAHCVRDRYTRAVYSASQVYVRVGSSQISNLKIHTVSRVQIDQRHIPIINDYDTAVLTLSSDLVFDTCVQPICLPDIWDDPMQTEFCMAAGWGLDSFQSTTLQYNLKKVELPIVPNTQCVQSYGTRYVNDLKICAGDWYNGGIDTCQGDSGGPLMCFKNNRFIIYGIVSFGSGCAGARYPGIYTRVPHQQIMGFIRSAAGLYE